LFRTDVQRIKGFTFMRCVNLHWHGHWN